MALGTVTQLLEGTRRDVEAISAIGGGHQGSVARELEAELLEAQRTLAARLRREAARFGGAEARFTGASARAYERQVALSLEYLQARMAGLTEAQATAAIATSMTRTVQLLEGLETRFTGIHRPLRLREADRMRAAVQGAQSTLLRHIPTSIDRYGTAMIGQFEGMMRVGMLTGASMDDMVAALTGHGGPTGMVSMRATVTPSGVLRLVEHDIPEGLFVRHRYWAERIVRTEVIRSYNGARLEGMRQIQQDDFPDLQKKIVAILDRRTAADSIAVDGQIRRIDEPFVDGAGRSYQYPPARPNDRETVIPWRPEWNPGVGRASRSDREALGELTQEERQAIVDSQRQRAGEAPLPPAPRSTAPRRPAAGSAPPARPVAPRGAQEAPGRPRMPALPRVATVRELQALQGTVDPQGRQLTVEATERRARSTIERIRRNRESGKTQRLREEAVAEYDAARARGAAVGRPLRELVEPRPTRDMELQRRVLQQARGNVEDMNRIMTGRTVPLGHWEPVRPIEIVRDPGDNKWTIQDGNHRMQAALEAGATEARVRMIERDARGRTVRDEVVVLPL